MRKSCLLFPSLINMILVQSFILTWNQHTRRINSWRKRGVKLKPDDILNAILRTSDISVLLLNAVGERSSRYNNFGVSLVKPIKQNTHTHTYTHLGRGIIRLQEICFADKLIIIFKTGSIACSSK